MYKHVPHVDLHVVHVHVHIMESFNLENRIWIYNRENYENMYSTCIRYIP